MRVIVVGAGAAGLTAALRAAEAGGHVTLLNAHPRIGLKILMSGGTRCNVTHQRVDERDYHGGSRPFVRRVLSAFPADEARAWLESLGVALSSVSRVLSGHPDVSPAMRRRVLAAVEKGANLGESQAHVAQRDRL